MLKYFLMGVLVAIGGWWGDRNWGQDVTGRQELWCQYQGQNAAGPDKHIVLIAGDDEYRSEEALPMLGRVLAIHHGFRCSVLFPINERGEIQPDFHENIPGMHLLDSADLVILALRFRNLPDDQMVYFDRYLQSGKPLIGLRTSTHAFRIPRERRFAKYSFDYQGDGWDGGFGKRVLGETWVSHHGEHGHESTRGVIQAAHRDHPILKGVKDIWGPTDVYGIRKLPATAQILLDGQVIAGMTADAPAIDNHKNDPLMPLAWTLDYQFAPERYARVFCTTMGAATDFQSAGLRRLLVNASLWCLELEDRIQAESNVSYVGTYEPSPFGFGTYRKNLKVSDFELR